MLFVLTDNRTSVITSATVDQSSEDITASVVVHSSEDTSTTTVQSSELSSKYTHEVPSSIPLLNYSTLFDKATMSSTGIYVLCDLFLIRKDIFFIKLWILCSSNSKHITSINKQKGLVF